MWSTCCFHRWFDSDDNSSGKLASILATDAAYIRGAVGDIFGVVCQNLAVMAVGYVIAFIFNWRMALLVTGAAPLVAVGGLLNIRFTMGLSKGSDKLYAQANQSVSEAVASIRVIQVSRLRKGLRG
jgi:ATP-binding cassette subfamily B (MDR/TAP) protein 1